MCRDGRRALARETEAALAILQHRAAETSGLAGAGDAVTFIGSAFRRPDSERVARLAVEKLALLAAAAGTAMWTRHALHEAAITLAAQTGDPRFAPYLPPLADWEGTPLERELAAARSACGLD